MCWLAPHFRTSAPEGCEIQLLISRHTGPPLRQDPFSEGVVVVGLHHLPARQSRTRHRHTLDATLPLPCGAHRHRHQHLRRRALLLHQEGRCIYIVCVRTDDDL